MKYDWEKNYDNWKLKGPYDDEPNIEVFKAENYEYYTTCYDTMINFETSILKFEKDGLTGEYDTREEYLEHHSDNLADELGLHGDEADAIEEHYEK